MTLFGEHACVVGRLCMGSGGDADFSKGGGHGDNSSGSIQSSLFQQVTSIQAVAVQ